MTVLVIAALAAGTSSMKSSGATRAASASSHGKGRTVAPECPQARSGLRYYLRQVGYWRSKMGAGATDATRSASGGLARAGRSSCPHVRHQAAVWRLKALRARNAYRRWWRLQYDWASWMPDKWQRIGACETGYGKRPGNFHWNSGTYQGFVGFYYGTWDAYRGSFPSEAYNATPRQQMIVAERVRADHGYGAWGCGGA